MQRATWTDERLDDLNSHVENGFNRIDAELRELRREMNARYDGIESRIDGLQRTTLQVGGGMIATFIVGFIGLLVAHT
jgi:hypothetical protein